MPQRTYLVRSPKHLAHTNRFGSVVGIRNAAVRIRRTPRGRADLASLVPPGKRLLPLGQIFQIAARSQRGLGSSNRPAQSRMACNTTLSLTRIATNIQGSRL